MKSLLILIALAAASASPTPFGITVTRVSTTKLTSTVFPTCYNTAANLGICNRKKKQFFFMDPNDYYQMPFYASPPQQFYRIQPSILPVIPYLQHQPQYIQQVQYQPSYPANNRYQPTENKYVEQEQEKIKEDYANDIESSVEGSLTDDPNARLFFNKLKKSLIVFETKTSTIIEMTTAKQTQSLVVSCIPIGAQLPTPMCPKVPVNPTPVPSGNAG